MAYTTVERHLISSSDKFCKLCAVKEWVLQVSEREWSFRLNWMGSSKGFIFLESLVWMKESTGVVVLPQSALDR